VTVQVVLGSSPRLGAVLTAAHLGALVAAAAAFPALALAPAGLAVMLSGLHTWQRHVMRSAPDAVVALRIDGAAVTLRRRNGREEVGRVSSLFVGPMLVILTVRCPGRLFACSIVIAPDATGAQAHRRLRVALKWGQLPADSPGSV
jgi:hypothetical protein